MASVAQNLEKTYPETNAKKGAYLVDLQESLVGSSRTGIWVLFAAVALVFLVACANTTTLLLTRSQTRKAEMAARAALGATSGRLAAQVVTETVVVFLLASVGGVLLARGLVDWFSSGLIVGASARTIALRVDPAAVLFSVAVCLVCGLAAGLFPALVSSRVEPQTVLKESAARAGMSRSHKLVQSTLVVAQVALAFALLVGSDLAVRSFARLSATQPGFVAQQLMTTRVVLPGSKYPDDAQIAPFFQEVLRRVAALPGVTAATANSTLPMTGSNSNGAFDIEGGPSYAPGEKPILAHNSVAPGYFATMGIPLLRGRDLSEADTAEGRPVVVLSQAAAERFFPGESPVGHRIDLHDGVGKGDRRWREVVGVVGDVRKFALDEGPQPEACAAFAQLPNRWMSLVVRSPRAGALQKDIAAAVQAVDPDQATSDTESMTELVADTIGPQRYMAVLLSAFALTALLLAVVGIFGLVSYTTSQRTRELGIRMALGSSPESVVALVMKDGLRLLGSGLALGLVCAVLVGRLLASRVAGVASGDPAVYGVIPVVLGVTCALACFIPAWRAARTPPAVALRYD